jgi:hypothetical protein
MPLGVLRCDGMLQRGASLVAISWFDGMGHARFRAVGGRYM